MPPPARSSFQKLDAGVLPPAASAPQAAIPLRRRPVDELASRIDRTASGHRQTGYDRRKSIFTTGVRWPFCNRIDGCFGSKAAYSVRAEILAAILAVTPSFAADPDNGERLAHRWCTSCHVVASDQRGPTGEAPPFKTIAAQRSPTLMPGSVSLGAH